MQTLVYKRTHKGDPDDQGEFGCNDCMKQVRSWPFEAVIGIGGLGAEPEREGIAYKLTWVGVGPHKRTVDWTPHPLVTFDHFRLFDEAGDDFRDVAPILAHRVYTDGIRATMAFTPAETLEIKRLLARARRWPPSPALEQSPPKRVRPCRVKLPSTRC